ncbi:Mitochondrial zinc maintenance protein 1, mitochondrial [Knufia obscura]|uniref:Mitochondrial zinc maintenance protein 1, mitochondrial n=2 Tax=Knufia TaxID=430999 RepID=A0AAN8ESU5_9EURO|nr:Mitochondrial zinc maintenance protein 1, mitochondrial [Knufia obscura]KAK5957987.1 Mitochondrial zinc maintenance protein 1, mitochondrial [Knufia fluminis]
MALAAYRHLLRATRIAFQGDLPLIHSARSQARGGFEKGRSLDPASKEAIGAIEHAEGVVEVLTKNIVQGQQTGAQADTYRLNIHEHTERGENDTVKNPRAPGGKVKVGFGGGCS